MQDIVPINRRALRGLSAKQLRTRVLRHAAAKYVLATLVAAAFGFGAGEAMWFGMTPLSQPDSMPWDFLVWASVIASASAAGFMLYGASSIQEVARRAAMLVCGAGLMMAAVVPGFAARVSQPDSSGTPTASRVLKTEGLAVLALVVLTVLASLCFSELVNWANDRLKQRLRRTGRWAA